MPVPTRRRRGLGEAFFLLVLAGLLWLAMTEMGAFPPSEAQQKVFRALGKKGTSTLVVFGAPT